MKYIKYILAGAFLYLTSCNKLNLNPLSSPSTGNFFSDENELTIAVNDLYRTDFIGNDPEIYTDNYWDRATLGNAVTFGTMASDDGNVLTYWTNSYKAIARATAILENLNKAAANTAPATLTRIEGEARFSRAYEYSRLIAHFGDVPLLTTTISLDSAYSYQRTGKDIVLSFVLSELDSAADELPATYAGDQRWTKGTALSIKARTALYMGKYEIARDAAAAVMALGVYSLYSDYRNLFIGPGETSKEIIMSVIKSQANGVYDNTATVQNYISRNAGGFGDYMPTYELMDTYECTDGLTIDKSPLYNPRTPFDNRDPRLTQTIVPFSTNWLSFDYQPHPDTLKVMNYKTGKLVTNNDTRANATFASYDGLLWKKGIDQTWADKLIGEYDAFIVRYAEVLLTYAEAKVELGEIDQSVADAINQVRARAYGVPVTQTAGYPAVSLSDQNSMRLLVRRERRVEFANEGLRYMDLIRWKLAEVALTRPMIGMPDPAVQDRSKWFFPGIPVFDANGLPDYSALMADFKSLANRNFDKARQYLWPVPAVEILVNKKITQNPNY